MLQHRGDRAGDATLHVDRAAAVQKTVLHFARERTDAPGALVAGRHHVGVAGEGDVRAVSADPRIEIVDVGSACFRERHAVTSEAGCDKRFFEHAQRAGVGRCYRGAADEVAGNGQGIDHAPRLTCMPPGGLALCGTNSISLCWSQLFAGEETEPSSMSASGSGPNRLSPALPGTQNISTRPHSHRMEAATVNGRTQLDLGSRSENWSNRPGTTKNGSIHQPLLSRSCSRLIAVAR